MENPFRNEKEIKLGEVTILLRPCFENVAAMEAKLGGLTYLAWKFSRSTIDARSGTLDPKNIPTLTECAQIIYFNQAATKPNDPNQKQYSLEEIWALVQYEGLKIIQPVTMFLVAVTAGNKNAVEPSEAQKKS